MIPHGHLNQCPTDTLAFRPIVSFIGIFQQKITQKNLFLFLREIQNINFNRLMISYEVCILFTSILLKETIDIAVNIFFYKYSENKITIRITHKKNSLQLQCNYKIKINYNYKNQLQLQEKITIKITRQELKGLFELETFGRHFFFDSNKQIRFNELFQCYHQKKIVRIVSVL